MEVTANVLVKLAGQGNIYVRSLADESDNESTGDLLFRPTFATASVHTITAPPIDRGLSVIHGDQDHSTSVHTITAPLIDLIYSMPNLCHYLIQLSPIKPPQTWTNPYNICKFSG